MGSDNSILFLTSVGERNPADVEEGLGIKICEPGELVIPNYPSGPLNMFISAETYGLCTSAEVSMIEGSRADLNSLHSKLCKQFPSLPDSLHEEYVIRTAVAAAELGLGKKVRVISSYDRADLLTMDGVEINLWESQPL